MPPSLETSVDAASGIYSSVKGHDIQQVNFSNFTIFMCVCLWICPAWMLFPSPFKAKQFRPARQAGRSQSKLLLFFLGFLIQWGKLAGFEDSEPANEPISGKMPLV